MLCLTQCKAVYIMYDPASSGLFSLFIIFLISWRVCSSGSDPPFFSQDVNADHQLSFLERKNPVNSIMIFVHADISLQFYNLWTDSRQILTVYSSALVAPYWYICVNNTANFKCINTSILCVHFYLIRISP